MYSPTWRRTAVSEQQVWVGWHPGTWNTLMSSFCFCFCFCFLGGGNLMLLLFVSREKSKDLLDWCYCLFFSFFSFEEARLQVPIARHPCSVISISYDQKKKKDEKKDHSTEWHFSYTRTQKVWDVGKESGITYYSCYLVHLGLHLQVRRFVTA